MKHRVASAVVLLCLAFLASPSLAAASPSDPTPPPTEAPTDKKSSTSEGVGYLCAGIAVLFFGSNFIPVKKFESGVMCSLYSTGLGLRAIVRFAVSRTVCSFSS